MDYSNLTIIAGIDFEDFNGDRIERRFDYLKADNIPDAFTFIQSLATAYADGLGGCTIKKVWATLTYFDVEPIPETGQPVTFVAFLTSEINLTTPIEYAIIEIPALIGHADCQQ